MKDYKYKINGNDYKVSIGDIENNIAQVEVNGVPFKVEIQETKAAPVTVKAVKPAAAPRTESGAKVISKPSVSGGQAAVKSPLPGVIVDLKVNVGDTVAADTVVAILEAMKMDNDIVAPCDGKVSFCVAKGANVESDSVLAVIS